MFSTNYVIAKLGHVISTATLYAVSCIVAYGVVGNISASGSNLVTQSSAEVAYTRPTYIPSLQSTAPSITLGTPSTLTIDSLNLQLSVLKGDYHSQSQTWDITEDSAHFATPSVVPNDHQGNTFIYGHKNVLVFERLVDLNPGAIVELATKEGHVFVYKYISSETLKPKDTTIFNYEGEPTLTLQTCSGSWNQFRTLYHLDFVEVKRV